MANWPYCTSQWQKLRKSKLSQSPLCVICKKRGRTELGTTVDHIKPINQGGDPFPEMCGLIALCERCHNEKTSGFDRTKGNVIGRRFKGCGADGTQRALCLHLRVSDETWRDWRNNRADLRDVVLTVDSVIYTQKFEGAAAGLLNPNLIARDLGLANRQEGKPSKRLFRGKLVENEGKLVRGGKYELALGKVWGTTARKKRFDLARPLKQATKRVRYEH